MDRKSKIWQIVLLVLLIAAIVALVLFNNQLNTSKTALSTTQEELAEAQKLSDDLQEKLDKPLDLLTNQMLSQEFMSAIRGEEVQLYAR